MFLSNLAKCNRTCYNAVLSLSGNLMPPLIIKEHKQSLETHRKLVGGKKMEFTVKSSKRSEFINITHDVNKVLKDSGVQNGVCTVYVPHTTAGVTVNEGADPDVVKDIIMKLDKLVPQNDGYSHSEGNSDAHIKASMMGASETFLIENGTIALGTWQKIYFCEFDGPRTRKVWLRIFGV